MKNRMKTMHNFIPLVWTVYVTSSYAALIMD